MLNFKNLTKEGGVHGESQSQSVFVRKYYKQILKNDPVQT